MNIYPKVSDDLTGLEALRPYVEKSKGIELQFFDQNGILERFNFENSIDELVKRVPEIKEVTIHPPLSNYDLELVLAKDVTIIEEQLKKMVELSRKYNIKMNIIYHTLVNIKIHRALTVDKIRNLLKIIEGENVTFLVENIFMFFEKTCTVFELCEEINHPQFKVCFDTTHLYCRANIDKTDVYEYAAKYLDKELCKKHIYQVHFAAALNGDGYVNHKTHGRVHPSIEEVARDLEFMKEYNMDNCNYISEVSEDDYSIRVDQKQEIKWMYEVIGE